MDSTRPSTRLNLPAWWVKAREESARGEDLGAMAQVARSGLAPALCALELNALAMILSRFQERLIETGGEGTLKLSPEEHLKDAGTAAKSRRFTFEKVLQLAAGLRILAADGEGYRAVPLFARDVWHVDPRSGEGEVELETASLGVELLLGYRNPYRDLVLGMDGEIEARAALGPNGPLCVWRSVWLDLGEIEQAIFLRMEKGMQWEFRWLQLEGIFGMPIDILFEGIRVPGAVSGGDLASRLKALARLGRKLNAHGLLLPGVGDQYLAMGMDESETELGLSLVWQVSRERLLEREAALYRDGVCRLFSSRGRDRLVERLLPVVLGRRPGEIDREANRAFWAGLDGYDGAYAQAGVALDQAAPLPLPWLAWEWRMRVIGDSRHPWPASLQSDALMDVLRRDAPSGAIVSALATYLDENPELAQALATETYLTLTSTATRSEETFAEALRSLGRDVHPVLASEPKEERVAKPRLVSDAPERAEEGRKGAVSGALEARMRKIASEELEKIRKTDPEGYKALKKTYLESLDEEGRRLILDVSRRMQSQVFEEHLRGRLVRFMVENPGSWRTAVARQGASFPS